MACAGGIAPDQIGGSRGDALAGTTVFVPAGAPHTYRVALDDSCQSHLRSDIPRLKRRVGLLNGAIRLALASGIQRAAF
jgi:hypothetical protein